MKVIFLDFDGVLNSHSWWRRQPKQTRDRHEYLLDPAAIGLLNQLVMRTGAHVVISSSWRICEEMRPAVTLCACGFTGVVIGQTPSSIRRSAGGIYVAEQRGDEIQAWLSDQHEDIESFVILDDDSDMAHLAHRHVKTSHEKGLTQEDVDLAVHLLNRMCRHCASNGIRATLEAVTTDRGEVQRCWQCGGEYKNGNLVWPEAP